MDVTILIETDKALLLECFNPLKDENEQEWFPKSQIINNSKNEDGIIKFDVQAKGWLISKKGWDWFLPNNYYG